MISYEDLRKCIDILAELNATSTSQRNKQLTLELGYIIKQELDIVKSWNESQQQLPKHSMIDVNKLLEDNIQLCRENETLKKDVHSLNTFIKDRIPSIEGKLKSIQGKFDKLNENIQFFIVEKI